MNEPSADGDSAQTFADGMSFAERSSTVSLFPAEQRIVDQLLAVPHYEIGIMTSADLSQLSGASRSSIDRLSRKLGYPGLKEMRRALAIQGGDRTNGIPADDRQSTSQIAERVMSAIASRAQAIGRSMASDANLQLLVDQLLVARSICLFGAGESAPVCNAIFLRLVRLGLPVQFVEEHHAQITLASLMRPQDLAVVVSFSGRTHSTLWAARIAHENGASVAAICGAPSSTLAKIADVRIALPVNSGLPGSAEVLDRIVAAALGEVLFQCIVAQDSEKLSASVKIDDIFAEDRT